MPRPDLHLPSREEPMYVDLPGADRSVVLPTIVYPDLVPIEDPCERDRIEAYDSSNTYTN